MAFHEQHERNCPTCGARMSATAPKCFNCGEFVDDEEDDDDLDAEGSPRWSGRGSLLRLAAVLLADITRALHDAGVKFRDPIADIGDLP